MRERQAAKRNVTKHMGSLPIRGCSLVSVVIPSLLLFALLATTRLTSYYCVVIAPPPPPTRTLVFATTFSHPYHSAALSMSPVPSLSFSAYWAVDYRVCGLFLLGFAPLPCLLQLLCPMTLSMRSNTRLAIDWSLLHSNALVWSLGPLMSLIALLVSSTVVLLCL
ncbi:hypothetical protein PRUPE_8G105000 [Prunus persica]|uniref:Uncharacterized protein n=1 Tax=Prunus persica TaxID=3760 RepID=A0A251MW42_PRUPE|nr:hypothetical protein PRUPE_8G105000 [Prunus persica]